MRDSHVRSLVCAGALILLPSSALAQSDPGRVSPAEPLTMGETFTIQSAALGELRRINVYLPAGYAQSKDRRFPVLYMPDGGMAEDFLHVAGLVQVSAGNGTMRPLILVGIENTQRRRDLTGPTDAADDRKIAPQVGGSAAFRQFLRAELIPAVNTRYRTTSHRAIVGESLAGLFVVETLFVEPDLFDTYVAFDPSLWWNRSDLVTNAARHLAKVGDRPKTLYIASSGEEELARLAGQLAGTLRAGAPASLTWHYELMPAETHATIYHPAALMAFRRVFKPSAGDR